jgi:hypothetical protein
MAAQEIQGEDYRVHYDAAAATVYFKGDLSLSGPAEYEPIVNLLHTVVATDPATMTLDLRKLGFLNSSGINMVSKFVLSLRKKPTTHLIVLGSNEIAWQGKSLKNLERLLPGVTLEME